MELSKIRRDVRKFIGEISKDIFTHCEYGEPSHYNSIHKKYSHLFSLDALETVKEALDGRQKSIEKEALKRLYNFLVKEYIIKGVSPIWDEIENKQLSLTVSVDGEEIPYLRIGRRLMDEKDRGKRERIFEAYRQVSERELCSLYEQEICLVNKLAKDLGHRNYRSLVEKYEKLSIEKCKAVIERFLADTEEVFKLLLEEASREILSLGLEDVREHDLVYLHLGERFEKFFPKERMTQIFKATVEGMGLGLENITIYDREREKKTPAALCFAMSVPNDIRIVFSPSSGKRDYERLFHEGGHALHWSNIKSRRLEFKYFWDKALSEAFATLFENLLVNRAWLRRYTDMPFEIERTFLKKNLLLKLQGMRYNLAKIIVQDRIVETTEGVDEFYSRVMKNAQLVRIENSKADALALGVWFYEINYLKAWLLEPQLRELLIEEFGENWFENKCSGRFLKRLWADGSKNMEDWAKELNLQPMNEGPLIQNIKNELRNHVDLIPPKFT